MLQTSFGLDITHFPNYQGLYKLPYILQILDLMKIYHKIYYQFQSITLDLSSQLFNYYYQQWFYNPNYSFIIGLIVFIVIILILNWIRAIYVLMMITMILSLMLIFTVIWLFFIFKCHCKLDLAVLIFIVLPSIFIWICFYPFFNSFWFISFQELFLIFSFSFIYFCFLHPEISFT